MILCGKPENSEDIDHAKAADDCLSISTHPVVLFLAGDTHTRLDTVRNVGLVFLLEEDVGEPRRGLMSSARAWVETSKGRRTMYLSVLEPDTMNARCSELPAQSSFIHANTSGVMELPIGLAASPGAQACRPRYLGEEVGCWNRVG